MRPLVPRALAHTGRERQQQRGANAPAINLPRLALYGRPSLRARAARQIGSRLT